jgi:hypothetical protein
VMSTQVERHGILLQESFRLLFGKLIL